jgi:predicted nucleic acid-binding protein
MAKHLVDLDEEALGAARAELGKCLGHAGVRGAIEHLASAGASGRPTIRDLEIGYSARIAAQWDRRIGRWMRFNRSRPPPPMCVVHCRFSDCLRSSQRGRQIPDLLVAAAAEEHHLTVPHYNGDFDLIAAVTGQLCRWIVSAGSAD